MSDTSLDHESAVVVAVGPGEREVARLQDLVGSIVAHEPRARTMVMVDDHPTDRALQTCVPTAPGVRLIGLHHPRTDGARQFRRGKGICSVILTGLKWIQANTDARFVLKLDTDSLVIGPYHRRLREWFARDPRLGLIGAHATTPNGATRDWSVHTDSLRELSQAFIWRRPMASVRAQADPLKQRVQRLIRAARVHGYRDGEHCLGGGYAVSRQLLDEMEKRGHLADPGVWVNADLPEDVMVGLHARALGFELADCVAPGDVFGVRHVGLPFPPAELLRRRYAVIHAVKNDADLSEADIREFFQARRPTRVEAPSPV